MRLSRSCVRQTTWVFACLLALCIDVKADDFNSIDGGFYGQWSEWTTCSSDCGTGISTRTRECMATNDVYVRSSETDSEVGRCTGNDKEDKLCNIQQCPPGRLDIRAKQCSRFNSRVYSGRRYQWQPYIKPSGKCELTCKAKGHSFYTRLSRSVKDGTPCREDGLAVCLRGRCVAPGCDHVLGSGKTPDLCSVCGGDGSSCRKYSSVFEPTRLMKGYNDVTVIPSGSKNINITEIGSSVNFIALKDSNGSYILNSPTKLNPPGEYSGLGTTFIYHRRQNSCLGSCIFAKGAINGALFVELRYYEGSNAIEFSYTLNEDMFTFKDESVDRIEEVMNPPPSPITLSGSTDNVYQEEFRIPNFPTSRISKGFSVLKSANEGKAQNDVSQTDKLSGKSSGVGDQPTFILPTLSSSAKTVLIDSDLKPKGTVSPTRYHRIFKPANNKYRSRYHTNGMSGNSADEKPRIPRYNPDDISLPLSGGRVRTNRHITGVNGGRPQPKSLVVNRYSRRGSSFRPYSRRRETDALRSGYPRKYNPSRNNNFRIQSALHSGNRRRVWRGNEGNRYSGRSYSNNLSSSKLVSRGVSNRNDRRSRPTKSTINTHNSIEVNAHAQKDVFFLRLTGFSECSVTCGQGNKTGLVTCYSKSTNEIVARSNCGSDVKPKTIVVPCNSNPCPPSWVAGSWGDCSTQCGTGSRKRNVECKQITLSGVKTSLPGSSCPEATRPETSELCMVDNCYKWSTGNWTECPTTCGKGNRTRQVNCLADSGSVVNDARCSDVKPASSEICDMGSCVGGWFAEPWPNKCPAKCGTTMSTRTVVCLNKVGELMDDAECRLTGNKPSTIRACKNNTLCGANWYTGPFSECNATCGEGWKTRDVVCVKKIRSRNKIIQVRDELCSIESKPPNTVSCPLSPCRPQWYTTEWSQCSATCGEGSAKREIKCLDMTQRPSVHCDLYKKPPNVQFCVTRECPRHESDPNCKDRFSRCSVVSKSGLCTHPYYRDACCHSCA